MQPFAERLSNSIYSLRGRGQKLRCSISLIYTQLHISSAHKPNFLALAWITGRAPIYLPPKAWWPVWYPRVRCTQCMWYSPQHAEIEGAKHCCRMGSWQMPFPHCKIRDLCNETRIALRVHWFDTSEVDMGCYCNKVTLEIHCLSQFS